MKNHVVSLELAKQLKEAGYPQDSQFWWVKDLNNKPFSVEYGKFVNVDKRRDIAAPLTTELLEQLPGTVSIYRQKGLYYIVVYEEKTAVELGHIKNKSLPDALAEMWLYLKKENLL